MGLEAFEDLDGWERADDAAREEAVQALCASLGGDGSFEPAPAAGVYAVVVHRPTGLSFVAIPGGRFQMGLRESDLSALREAAPDTPATILAQLEKDAAGMRPVREVTVAPFLLGRSVLDAPTVERLTSGRLSGRFCHRMGWSAARELASSLGFRLVSEAEMEWTAREGGRQAFAFDAARQLSRLPAAREEVSSRFGLERIFDDAWCEDGYHPTYAGAPSTSEAWTSDAYRDPSWMNGAPCGVARGYGPPDELEGWSDVWSFLAALRGSYTRKKGYVRLARSLRAS